MQKTEPTERLYVVIERRVLFFNDPTSPGINQRDNVWAEGGEYIDASHPLLQGIIKTQRHKVVELKVGDVIPEGAIFHDSVSSPYIRRLMDEYDGKDTRGGKRTAEERIVGDGAAEAPALTEEPKAPKAKKKASKKKATKKAN